MRLSIALGAVALALAVTGSANAGGWASVGVAPLPTGVQAGEVWQPEITVLQHGRTPLEGLSPTLTITDETSGTSRDFAATATDEPGVYTTRVVFPEPGEWNVVVESGFWGEGRLTFGPETIVGGGTTSSSPLDVPVAPLVLAGAVLLACVAAAFAVRRRWRPLAPGQ